MVRKKSPRQKNTSLFVQHCIVGEGGAGFYFAPTGLTQNGFLDFYSTFDFSGLAPRTHHGFRFPFFCLAPVGDGGGCCRSIPSPSHSPSGGVSGVVVGGPVPMSVSICPPPLLSHMSSPAVLPSAFMCMHVCLNNLTNSGVGGWQRRQFPNGFHSYHTFCNTLLGQEHGVGGWQMRASGVECYRTYENCENR